MIGTTLCYGAIRVSSARFHDGPRLALLQSNIEQKHKNKGNADPIITEFTELVDRALAHRERPDLIVWPETAYPYGFISVDPAIEPATLEKQVRAIRTQMVRQGVAGTNGMRSSTDLHSWTDRAKVPMLVGTRLLRPPEERARSIQLGDPVPAESSTRFTSITRCTWFRSASISR